MDLLKDTLVATAPITSPADKFYNFFKNDMSELCSVFPACFKGAVVVEGEEGTVGCCKDWTYVIGGIELIAKVKVESIDDEAKSITFATLEGSDVLKMYKSFKSTVTVSTGLVTWTIVYERKTPITPPPEPYIPVVVTATTLVDSYLMQKTIVGAPTSKFILF